uniref:NXPE C-terminal domain-containing protein n=1 Tax=Ornithorhynchus anatinus TaxID=9258 RepID=A0A6I8P4T5_ORNAN
MGVPSPESLGSRRPALCILSQFNRIQDCLMGKPIYLTGGSTLHRYAVDHPFISNICFFPPALKAFDHHANGKRKKHVLLDPERHIQIQWKRHGEPFMTQKMHEVKEGEYVTREIDKVAGDKRTAVVFTLGQQLRPFSIDLFIHGAISVRGTIRSPLFRSPDTKPERFSHFHSFVQYLAMMDVFRDVYVGVIDACNLSVTSGTNDVHSPECVVGNQINMFLNYIC